MTDVWLIIPVKPFGEGKSRLAVSLSVAQRAELSRRLLERVLRIAHETHRFAGVMVISRDRAVRAVAAAAAAVVLNEEGDGLNAALSQARMAAVQAGAAAILVLPADLPRVTSADLLRLLDACHGAQGVTIAPSRDGGTNALLLQPPDILDFDFGPDSFSRHCTQAERTGVPLHVVDSPTLAFDVDHPEDLAQVAAAALTSSA